MWSTLAAVGQAADTEAYGDPAEGGEAEQLAGPQSDADADEDVGRVGEGGAGELNAGVAEREDRNDEVARPWMDGVDQPVAR